MLFNSLQFAAFFVVVTSLFFALPHRFRGALLLAASVYFYMAFVPVYILILIGTILVDYAAGFLIDGSQGRARKSWLIVSIVANVGVLAFFKYFNFVNDTFRTLTGFAEWRYPIPALDIILPIGLSFHTFQSMVYTIEVYRGHQPVERNLWRFALYVLFYPQLVAGPIERPQNLLQQLHVKQAFDYDRAKLGLQLMAWGLFKKVVIADRVAPVVNAVYQHPDAYSGSAVLVATYLFAIQIYDTPACLQPTSSFFAQWLMARSKLDLCRLGSSEWLVPGVRDPHSIVETPIGRALTTRARSGFALHHPDSHHFSFDITCMGILQGGFPGRCGNNPALDCHVEWWCGCTARHSGRPHADPF